MNGGGGCLPAAEYHLGSQDIPSIAPTAPDIPARRQNPHIRCIIRRLRMIWQECGYVAAFRSTILEFCVSTMRRPLGLSNHAYEERTGGVIAKNP